MINVFDVDANGVVAMAFDVSTTTKLLFASAPLLALCSMTFRTDGGVIRRAFTLRSFASAFTELAASDDVVSVRCTADDDDDDDDDAFDDDDDDDDEEAATTAVRLVGVVFTITPGTMAAGTGGIRGNGSRVGSRVGKSGGRTSGNLLYRFSFGDIIFISRNFKRNVSTHSCMISLQIVVAIGF